MRPDLTAIVCTLILPLAVLFCIAWKATTIRLSNRRKQIYLQQLHRKYRQ